MTLKDELITVEASIALDDLVHDTASQIASEINNGGTEAQLQYLLDNGWTEEHIRTQVLENAKEFASE